MEEARADFSLLELELVLYGLQSPVNIGMILRIAEAFQFVVSVFDPHGVLDSPEKLRTIEDFSCGARARRGLRMLESGRPLAELRGGKRIVATSIVPDAQPLSSFHFLPSDVLVLGNEYDGLPDHVTAEADALLKVSTPLLRVPKERSHSPIDPTRTAPVLRDGEPSLNVAVTAGIVCHAAYVQWLGDRGRQ